MTILDTIKNKIGDYVFQKKFNALKRSVKTTNLKNAITIGIIYNASNEDTCNKVKAFVKVLKDDKKKVKALGYIDGKVLESYHLAKLEFDFFSPADLNWYGHQNSAVINNFTNEKFDILLDLNFDNCKPTYYIAALSKSTFKVGKLSPQNKLSHDFLIDISQSNSSVDFFIKQVQHYLQLMNTHSYAAQ